MPKARKSITTSLSTTFFFKSFINPIPYVVVTVYSRVKGGLVGVERGPAEPLNLDPTLFEWARVTDPRTLNVSPRASLHIASWPSKRFP
jgi:hypothetical protein